MQTFKLNDLVYTYFGYGSLINLGRRKKQIVQFDKSAITHEQRLDQIKTRVKRKHDKKKFKEAKIKKFYDKKEKQIETKEQNKNPENNQENQKVEIEQIQPDNTVILFEELPNCANELKESELTFLKNLQVEEENQKEEMIEPPPSQIKKQINLVKIKLKNGSVLELPETELRQKIQIYVKTFAENNQIYGLNLSIFTSIIEIKNLVIAQFNYPKCVINSKLFNPINQLTELTNGLTLETANIPSNAKLLLIVTAQLSWDPSYKGAAISLSNSNLTAQKNFENDFQTVLANYPITQGKNYWEIKIDKSFELDDIFIGIAQKNINLYSNPIKANTFWGYICRRGQIFGPNFLQYYGLQAQIDDVIGVLLEYIGVYAQLSFYVNGIKCGIAFKNLTGEFYPAVCMYYSEVQVTLIPKPQLPYY